MLSRFVERMVVSCLLIWAPTWSSVAQTSGAKSAQEGPRAKIFGTWKGNSVCMVENSPCHDEINVYRFAEIAGKTSLVLVTASKVVDDKEIVLGTEEWKYNPEKQALEWEGPHGTFHLTVGGDKMEGSLTDKDGTVYRRIYLKKEK